LLFFFSLPFDEIKINIAINRVESWRVWLTPNGRYCRRRAEQ